MENQLKEKYESFWLYPESHPYRLFQHITLRGAYVGAVFGFLGGIPYALYRKKQYILASAAKNAFYGGIGTGAIFALIALERLYHLDRTGIEDRSYRISYNWGQTKWDYLCGAGSLVSCFLLKRTFGGVGNAAAAGIVLGTGVNTTLAIITKEKKKSKSIVD